MGCNQRFTVNKQVVPPLLHHTKSLYICKCMVLKVIISATTLAVDNKIKRSVGHAPSVLHFGYGTGVYALHRALHACTCITYVSFG